jgi:Zn-dependent peptidase ImmA (M78 family)
MMTHKGARNIAQKALDLAWDGHLPVDPVRLGKNLTIRLKRVEREGEAEEVAVTFREQSNEQLNGASSKAFVERTEQGLRCEIAYNQDEIIYRNRFAVAHELGLLIMGYITEGAEPIVHHTYSSDTRENELATKFALALLMPEKITCKLFPSARTIQEFAEAFGVSNAAAIARVKELGLL